MPAKAYSVNRPKYSARRASGIAPDGIAAFSVVLWCLALFAARFFRPHCILLT